MSEPITQFTTSVPFWSPRITPINLEEATERQLDAMKVTPSNMAVSEYVLVLAHDPQTLKERTPLFNSIMYSRGGLSRAETELAAVATSVANRCIYCAAVHSKRYNELTNDESVTATVFDESADSGLTARQRAIVSFATKLSKCPPEANKADVDLLVENGLDMAEILDVILSTSLFGWANRLMHILGDPMPRDE